MIKKNLIKQQATLYSFSSNILYTFAIWFTALMINHFFGAKTLGEYSFVQAVISPIALFFRLQLKVLVTLEMDIKKRFSNYFSVYIVSEIIFIFVLLLLGLVLNQRLLFYTFAVFKVFESLHMLVQGYHQSKNNFKKVFSISFLRSLTLIGVLWGSLSQGFSLSFSFITISIIWLLFFLIIDLPKLRKDGVSFYIKKNIETYKPLLITGASLSIISGLDTLNVAIPRYFIRGYFNEIDLGKFTMVLQFFVASTIFVVSVGHPFLVKLKHLVENKQIQQFKKEVKKTSFIFLFFSVLIIVFFVFSSEFLMRSFWGEEYAYLGKFLTISMIGLIPMFLSSVLVYSITALKYYSLHLKYYPIVVIFAIIFSWIMIPRYGVFGGVIVIVLTQFIRLICVYSAFKFCLAKEIKKNII